MFETTSQLYVWYCLKSLGCLVSPTPAPLFVLRPLPRLFLLHPEAAFFGENPGFRSPGISWHHKLDKFGICVVVYIYNDEIVWNCWNPGRKNGKIRVIKSYVVDWGVSVASGWWPFSKLKIAQVLDMKPALSINCQAPGKPRFGWQMVL